MNLFKLLILIFGITQIILLGLKLFHIIKWGWGLVTIPIWGGSIVLFVLGIVFLLVMMFGIDWSK